MAAYRTLIETHEYTSQLIALIERYSIEAIEASLQALWWGIATNPERHEHLIGSWYMTKSRSFQGVVPPLVIYFSVEDQNRVILLFIEEYSSMTATVKGLLQQ